jgi:ubiquinol-cytochrome c reductase cytochrome b subunit
VVVGAAQAARVPVLGDWLTGVLFAGQTVGGATLTRFYATHVFMIPAIVFGLLGLHLYLVIRHGVSEPPVPGVPVDPKTYRRRYDEHLHRAGVPFWPDAGWKDVVFALAVGSIVLLLAIVLGPPHLGNKADPTLVNAFPRPDWYLLWYFALLALVPPNVEDAFIILFPLLLGLVLVLLPFVASTGERSFRRRPWAVGIVVFVKDGVATLVALGSQAPWSPVLEAVRLPPAVTASLSGPSQDGARLFEEKGCISCHRVANVGGQRGPDLSTVGARLSSEQLTWRILNGGRNMPAYGGTLTPDETTALVQFLATLR